MASDKKRRKLAKFARKRQEAPGATRQPDGDRRRRGLGITVREAIAHKRAMQGLEGPPVEGEGEVS